MDKTLSTNSAQLAYSLKEAASIIGLGDRKFHQEVLDGKIDVVKIGKRRLVTRTALSNYLEVNTCRAFNATEEAQRILQSKKFQQRKKSKKRLQAEG